MCRVGMNAQNFELPYKSLSSLVVQELAALNNGSFRVNSKGHMERNTQRCAETAGARQDSPE